MITVRDVVGMALPAGTLVVAGAAGLGREVTWASRVRPTPPAFGHLSGGELVLLPANVLPLLDERLTLAAAIRQLAAFGVAGIAQVGAVDVEARVVADETGVPLLQLPDETDLSSLERETARYVTDRRRAVLRRGQDVGRRLMELAIAGETLSTIVRGLADLAGRPVVLEGRDGRLLAYHLPSESGSGSPRRVEIEPILVASYSQLAPWLRATTASSPADPPTTLLPLDDHWSRVTAPVIGRDGLLGSLSLIVPRDGPTPEDGVLTSRGAAACAVVLAREQAAANVRREVELNVLDEVLDGALRSEVSLLQQARRLGHDLESPHVVFVVRLDRHPEASMATITRQRDGRWMMLDEVLTRAATTSGVRDARPLWRVRNDAAEIVWPVATSADAARVGQAIQDELVVISGGIPTRATASRPRASTLARTATTTDEPGTATVSVNGAGTSGELFSIGFGRSQGGIEGIRRSHREARQTITLGRRLHGPGHLTGFDDLGVYRIIYAAEQLPELRTFYEETLDALLAYDRRHGADLIRTLDAFFQANCSPKEAASLLSVHRNTVLYRLDRIGEITALDLNDADVRLRLQIALRIHIALFGEE